MFPDEPEFAITHTIQTDIVCGDVLLDLFTDEDAENMSPQGNRVMARNAFGKNRLGVMPLPQHVIANDHDDVQVEEASANKIVVHRGKRPRKELVKVRQPNVLKKKDSALKECSIAEALRPCCPKKCYSRFTFDDVQEERHQFWQLSAPKQYDWLKRELGFNGVADLEKGTFNFKYVVQDKPCCGVFLEHALPVSHGRLSDIRKSVLNKNFEDTHRTVPDGVRSSPKADQCESFIRNYAAAESGQMPHSVDCDLAEGVTKEDVFTCYMASFEDTVAMQEAAGLSCWYDTWRFRCPTVQCRKWQRFSKCSVCSNLRILKDLADPGEKGTLK